MYKHAKGFRGQKPKLATLAPKRKREPSAGKGPHIGPIPEDVPRPPKHKRAFKPLNKKPLIPMRAETKVKSRDFRDRMKGVVVERKARER